MHNKGKKYWMTYESNWKWVHEFMNLFGYLPTCDQIVETESLPNDLFYLYVQVGLVDAGWCEESPRDRQNTIECCLHMIVKCPLSVTAEACDIS